MSLKSRQHSDNRRAVKIKHGSAPEIQEVNIAIRKKRSGDQNGFERDNTKMEKLEEPFFRRRPPSKTMTTTKSTMTNEEDYQLEVVKSQEDGEVSSAVSEMDDRERNFPDTALINDEDKEVQQQKVLAWKMTPKVHFPPNQESLPSPSHVASNPRSTATACQTLEWQYLPDQVIEPTFEHRPDKTYLIHQTPPDSSLNPLKVWPGYGGNLYFEPVRVQPKPLNARQTSDRTTVSRGARSRASSRFTFRDHTSGQDAFSDLRNISLPPSSPRLLDQKRIHYSPDIYPPSKYIPASDILTLSHPGDFFFQRQMSRLDKDYVLGMKGNTKLHEDWSWIAGMESIGTLRLGDKQRLQTQQRNQYSRTLIVEKVPRNFVFHPGNKINMKTTSTSNPLPLVQAKIENSKLDNYPAKQGYSFWKKQSISNWSLQAKERQHISKRYDSGRDLVGNPKLPGIFIGVKGKKLTDTGIYNSCEPGARSSKAFVSAKTAGNYTFRKNDCQSKFKYEYTHLIDKDNRNIGRSNGQLDRDLGTEEEYRLKYNPFNTSFSPNNQSKVTSSVSRVPNTTPC